MCYFESSKSCIGPGLEAFLNCLCIPRVFYDPLEEYAVPFLRGFY